MEKEVDKRHWR